MGSEDDAIRADFLRRLGLIEQGYKIALVDLHIVYTLPGDTLKGSSSLFISGISVEDVLRIRLAVSHAAVVAGVQRVEVKVLSTVTRYPI